MPRLLAPALRVLRPLLTLLVAALLLTDLRLLSAASAGPVPPLDVTVSNVNAPRISAHIDLAQTRRDYGVPFFGTVTADLPTTVPPDGRVEMIYGGKVVASYDVRTDGTFALQPNVHPCPCWYPVEVRLVGGSAYADTAPGAGSWVGDVRINPMATELSVAHSQSPVAQGEAFWVRATLRPADPDALYVPSGTITVRATPAAGGDAVPLASLATQGGAPLGFDLTTWAREHPGQWLITVEYVPGTVDPGRVVGSSSQFSLDVRQPRPWPTDTELSTDRTELVVEEALTGSVRTLDRYGTDVTATTTLEIDGETWAHAEVENGRFRLTGLPVGVHTLRAHHPADAETGESTSPPITITVAAGSPDPGDPRDPGGHHQQSPMPHPAATTLGIGKVKALAGRRVRLKVTVGAAVPVTGTVVVTRGTKVVATGLLRAGRVTLTTKRLPRGRARLRIAYAGAPGLLPAPSRTVRVRVR
ncbi:Ig-like domain repeat protein [Nocardioides sp. L-11A]|uniref:Ig-like domain repeat protein n=1 Tax=Nocardioides sp. L-11A TaxID=3043848 RepID=UPI00249A50CC|nr:hypothetical protein QJ852_06060 [Nocardioides sp. L-11A]